VLPPIKVIDNGDGTFSISIKDVNSDDVLAASEAIETAVEAIQATTGAVDDAIIAVGAVGTISAKLRRVTQGLADLLTGIVLAAGTAIIGKVRLVTATGDEITDDTADAAKVLPVNAAGSEIKSHERHTIVEHPFGKDKARTDGVQWCDEVVTSATEWTVVESKTIEPPVGGTIVELEVGITFAHKSASTVKFVRSRVQARNKDGTWVTIIDDGTSPASGNAYVEKAASAAAYTEYTLSGRIEVEANLNTVPIDIKVEVYPEDDGTEHATGKVKNSSYVKITYDE